MKIDILNNTPVLDEIPLNLKGYQKSQIHYLSTLPGKGIDSILPKLLAYLDKERIVYTLSSSCQECLSRLNELEAEFQKAKAAGRAYKDGSFDSAKFSEFATFVRDKINKNRTLKEHQQKAAYHLYLVGNGANFSVPGSGKTAAVLTAYEKLRNEGTVNLLFVIGPPACFSPWREEFKLTLGRKPDWRILAGGDQIQRKLEYYSPTSQKAELYLTTYQTLLNDQEEIATFLGKSGNKAFLIIDEAHYIKQTGGNWASAVLRIAKYGKYRCVLTGTPIPRDYTDVFNMFDFLWPDSNPIDSEAKIRLQIYQDNDNYQLAKDILKETTGPLFYRVRKSELGLIPPAFHPPCVLPMNSYEKMIYNAIENRIRDKALSNQDYLEDINLIWRLRRGRIIRLRQCVSNVKLLSTAIEDYEEDLIEDESGLRQIIIAYDTLEIPRKLEYLCELVGKLQEENKKVVIWAHFVRTLELIKKHLSEAGFACKLIYGQTPIEQISIHEEETREKIRNEFVDPKSGLDILVANPAACGESISLHKTCHHAIYYDLSYNCAQYLQSLDRIHRVGGSEIKQANYHFLQYENTIDQDIMNNLNKKAEKMYDIVEEDYSIYSLDMFEEDNDVAAYNRLFGEN